MPLLFWFSTSALTLLVFGGIKLIPVKPPPPNKKETKISLSPDINKPQFVAQVELLKSDQIIN